MKLVDLLRFDDARRLEALADYRLLDTPPEEVFDNITQLTAKVFRIPIALVTLVDAERQWFKSHFGFERSETPREQSFCDHTIRGTAPFVVNDTLADPRFAQNPLVTGEPGIRFYCGVALRTPEGHGLGALCLIDRQPRTMSEGELTLLQNFARQVEIEFEIRRRLGLLEEALERQHHQQRSKEILAAMLVHDLRSPLTSLTVLASLVEPADGESRQSLDEMLTEAMRMRRMLNDVLDICLHQVGQLRARRLDLALEPFIQAVAHRLRRIKHPHLQQLALDLPAAPVTINADPELLERVLENLVINAVEHGPTDQPILIALSVAPDGGLQVEVRDRGEVIPAEARGQIFDVFHRLGDKRRATARGYGLGLAFCRLAIEAHGGKWQVPRVAPWRGHFGLARRAQPVHGLAGRASSRSGRPLEGQTAGQRNTARPHAGSLGQ